MDRKEAIEIIIKNYPHVYNSGSQFESALRELIPELKESEDERIMKAISAAICGTTAETVLEANGVKLVDALSYLEKQKEQKVDIDKLRKDIYQSGYNDGYQHGKVDAQKEQNPAEWSEEDEKMLCNVYESLYAYQCDIRAGRMDKNARELLDDVDAEKAWLKSLPARFHFAHCKPSEEQPEVDLEKEIARFALNGGTGDNTPTIGETAHHFYELGLNARKEE